MVAADATGGGVLDAEDTRAWLDTLTLPMKPPPVPAEPPPAPLLTPPPEARLEAPNLYTTEGGGDEPAPAMAGSPRGVSERRGWSTQLQHEPRQTT